MNNYLQTRKILSYDDIVHFPSGTSVESMVRLQKYDSRILTEYIKHDMQAYTGDFIYIRDSLARKLANVDKELSKLTYRLKVTYGYRHPLVQEDYFLKRRSAIKVEFPNYTDAELDRYTHNFVAIPDIAGHPAGAAVDLTIVDKHGDELDMGTAIADYTDPNKIITFANSLTSKQLANRKLLHDLMIAQEFAPFYGEWWHFSYGDREWAAFYNKKALYGALEFTC
jgi:D-alanyl-D-alanine dipeptidase